MILLKGGSVDLKDIYCLKRVLGGRDDGSLKRSMIMREGGIRMVFRILVLLINRCYVIRLGRKK